ncbi:glycosyltransferase family 9 protein [Oceanihabitans sp. 2_MG-2023]|uniref:glycosyltransferase family 9 protein n=1 Tax=Oceanihabitans sp. 2_MG-2023 TaxID=3062661 RepID=UPI0026E26DDD|nr:glycosyltransferase family 9 protein [Oceanihabitans sp. 2_MG-2023]MDO6595907.1 glycosyltransferase family 9 protein [Oceanihabitans sp. 2_MG-2023]
MKTPKHILVIRLSAMGDVAMTVPVLSAFTQQHPNVKITFLTREFFSPFFRDLKNVTVYSIDLKGKHKGVFGLYKLSKELKKLQIDAVADLHNVLRTKILKAFFFGIPFVQINKGRAEKKALISGKVFKQLKSTHERYADVFKVLGLPIDLTKPTFSEKISLPKKMLSITGEKTKKWIGIAPFATYKSKMYPLEAMQIVIEALSKKHTIFLFGGKQDIPELQRLERNSNVINLAGQLSLNEELDVISNLDVMLSMDSGNAHLAAMLGKKAVTIWGVTHPFAGFYPFNQPENYALLADRKQYPLIPTSIYGNKFPEGYENAAKSISTQKIIDLINTIL